MRDPYAGYIRQVGRELELPRRRKRTLLAGLRLELEERFLQDAGPEEILAQVGSPAETARFLMESVQPKERGRHRVRKRWWTRCAVAALAVLLAVAIGMVFWMDAHQIVRVKTTITEDPVPIDYSNDLSGFDYSNNASGN